MTVQELIRQLSAMPASAPVRVVYDGNVSLSDIPTIYLARNGCAMIVKDDDEPVYCTEWRPLGAPTEEEDMCWDVRSGY